MSRRYQEFYAPRDLLFEKDLGERTLTHRLAVHLEKQFSGWEVDCDYNRLGERTLRLPHGSIVSTDDELGKSIYPDIVVHQREIPEQPARDRGPEGDQSSAAGTRPAQAAGLTDPHLWFAYRIGVFVTLGKKRSRSSEVYIGGVIDPALSIWLAGRLKDAGLRRAEPAIGASRE